MLLGSYLNPQLITFLNAANRDEALLTLIDLLDRKKILKDRQRFLDAILQREKIVSTGIGMGVAIPHAKLEEYEDFFIAIGIQSNLGIEWDAIDGAPVKLIFLIGGPEGKQSEYLKILSQLTSIIKDEKLRKTLILSKDPLHIIQKILA